MANRYYDTSEITTHTRLSKLMKSFEDITDSLFGLTAHEISQLQNIDSTTISTTQWGYLGAMNQGVATGSSVSFTSITDGTASLTGGALTGLTTLNASTGLVKTTAGTISYITDSSASWNDAYTKRVDSWTAPLGLAANTASITQSGVATDGYLDSTDWNTFNDKEPALTKGNLTEVTSSVLTITGGTGAIIGAGTTLNVAQANTTVSGYLSSTDWNTFNDLNTYIYDLGQNTNEPSGFVNRTDSTLSWSDAAPRTLTIAPAVTSFDFYELGVKYTKSASETRQITNAEGLHYIYYDGGSLTSVANPTDIQTGTIFRTKAIVAIVYWDATNNLGELFEERHGIQMDGATHELIHFRMRTLWISGLALGNFVIGDGSLDTHAQFSIATGVIADEDLWTTTNTLAYTVGAEVWYLDGSNWRKETNAGFSVLTAGTGRLAYNNAGAQTEVTNNQFVLAHVFGWNAYDANPITIQGQAKYATLKLARLGAITELSNLILSGLPGPEMKPVGTVIFQTNNGYANAVKAKIVQTDTSDNYVDWRYDPLSPAQPATDHGALSGNDDDDHIHYLLADGTRDLTGDWTIATNSITLSAGTLSASTLTDGVCTINAGAILATNISLTSAGAFVSLYDTTAVAVGNGSNLNFYALNSSPANFKYASIKLNASSVTAGSEKGKLTHYLANKPGVVLGVALEYDNDYFDVRCGALYNVFRLTSPVTTSRDTSIDLKNTGTDSADDTYFNIQTASAAAGDPYLKFTIDSVAGYSVGIDNTDDALKVDVGVAAKPGSATAVQVATDYTLNARGPINVFGEWTSPVSHSTTYTALTDGFVVAYIHGGSDGDSATMWGQTPVGTTRCEAATHWYSPANVYVAHNGFTMPVRKGDTFTIGWWSRAGSPGYNAYWISLGTYYTQAGVKGFT